MPQSPPIIFAARTLAGKAVPLLTDAANGALIVEPAGATAYNTNANTTGTQIKSGSGTLQGVTVNTGGTSSTATLYDGTSTAGTKLATIATTALASLSYGVAFNTGLYVVLAGSAAADVTVSYR